MFKKFFSRSKKVVGVDWGLKKIKMVLIEAGSKLSVCGLSSAEVVPGAAVHSEKEIDENLIASICLMADDLGIKDEKIVLAVEGNHVFLKHLKIPHMPKRELRKAVQWEVDRLFPGTSSGIYHRYLILGDLVEGEKIFFNVLLLVVKEKLMKNYYYVFQACGLNLAAIDIPALAIWNLYKSLTAEAAALIYISDGMVNFVVMGSGQIYFIRTFPKYDAEYILNQLEITLMYLKNKLSVPSITKIILSGSLETFQNLDSIVKHKFGIAVQYGVLPDVSFSEDIKPGFEVALGLAVRGAL